MLAAAYRRHGPLFWQLVRYGITGGLASVVNIGLYLWLNGHIHLTPNQAWTAGFVGAVVTGYAIHSRWSFRGHGRRDNLARTGGRFVVVSLISFALNSFWVWLLVQHLRLPNWAPIPLILFVTPLSAFSLNRRWVFE